MLVHMYVLLVYHLKEYIGFYCVKEELKQDKINVGGAKILKWPLTLRVQQLTQQTNSTGLDRG